MSSGLILKAVAEVGVKAPPAIGLAFYCEQQMAATADVHFVTFGAGQEWPQAAERLARQARATRIFASISVETGDTIFDRYPEFRRHASFVQANPRGWGYWLWKPFLIQQHLRRLPDGAVLLYLDAGCEIFPRNARKLAALLEI